MYSVLGSVVALLVGCGSGGRGDDTPGIAPAATPSPTSTPVETATPVLVPTATSSPQGPVAFAVSRRQVVRSDDGGRNWSVVLTVDETIELRGVAFADREHGWVVGGSEFGYGAALLRTEDGGVTWTDQLPNVAGLSGGPPNTFSFWAIAATSPMHAVAVGAEQQSVAVFQPPALVAVTDDGGASWRAAPIRRLSNRGGALRAVCLNSSGTGIAVGNGYIGTGSVFVTADHGATWSESAAVEALDQGDYTTITGAACADSGAFWISGTNIGAPPAAVRSPRLLYSPVMGYEWENRTPPPRTSSGRAALPVTFVDARLGWAVTGWVIHRTTDAGGTWESAELPGAGAVGYYGVAFDSPSHGIVVGSSRESAIALATFDGGATWEAGLVPPDLLPWSLLHVVIVP